MKKTKTIYEITCDICHKTWESQDSGILFPIQVPSIDKIDMQYMGMEYKEVCTDCAKKYLSILSQFGYCDYDTEKFHSSNAAEIEINPCDPTIIHMYVKEGEQ